jgi:two-component system, NtrC family, sensor histidine kinase PilS
VSPAVADLRRRRADALAASLTFPSPALFRWLFLGRLAVVGGVLLGALTRGWLSMEAEDTRLITIMFVVALVVTAASFWHTRIRSVPPGPNFLYIHVITDIALATGIVEVTGGAFTSPFAPLYVLVIAEAALLLPFAAVLLMGMLTAAVYLWDLMFRNPVDSADWIGYQVALFAIIALVTGALGERLKRKGALLGSVELELRQLRLDTGDILDSVNTGVLTVDGHGRLAYLNPAAESILGLDARQWLGSPVLTAVERVAPGLGEVLLKSIEDGIPVSRFRTATSHEGKTAVIGVSTTVLTRPDGVPSVTALFQDISDQERMEALNQRAARLEAVAELSASLAHEIKNPLASIRSAVEQLTKPRLAGDDRALLSRLVLSESDRLSRLLSEFLEFSGLTMGRTELVDVRDVAKDSIALVKQHPERPSEVQIELRLTDGPKIVHGDRDLLHRAVFNLVLNAVQFSAPEGKVLVEVSGGAPADAHGGVRLSVRDTGPGVSPEDLPRIFDPFYTRRPGGSGLGLSVVHRAVAAHGGNVIVERAPGGGAEFVIELPGALAEPASVDLDVEQKSA